MKVHIISPQNTIYKGNAEAVTVPGHDGSFQILDHHAPIISTLKAGIIKIDKPETDLAELLTKNGQGYEIEIKGGVVEVNQNGLNILIQ